MGCSDENAINEKENKSIFISSNINRVKNGQNKKNINNDIKKMKKKKILKIINQIKKMI